MIKVKSGVTNISFSAVYKLILPECGLRNLHVELTLYEKYLIGIMSFKTTKVAFNVKEFQRLIRFFECFFQNTNKAFVTLDLQEC